MKFIFNKYHSNGNDFLLFLDKNLPKDVHNKELINRLCDRHTGIGADGLFIISSSDKYSFFLDYYNADGSWETLCVNGSRCAAQYMYETSLDDKNMMFGAGDGLHRAKILDKGNVSISMKPPEYKSACISPEGVDGFFIDTGARHFVCESKNLDDDFVFEVGRKIRYAPEFHPRGINVNFYRLDKEGKVEIKTYEKGVEQVMFSCASGSAAVAFHVSKVNAFKSPVITHSYGGMLVYTFNDDWSDFWSKGPVEFLFKGEFNTEILK